MAGSRSDKSNGMGRKMTAYDRIQETETSKEKMKLAKIEARKAAFDRSPFWFTFWDVSVEIVWGLTWVAIVLLMAQCSCDCVL